MAQRVDEVIRFDTSRLGVMLKRMSQIDLATLPDDVETLRALIVANQLDYDKALKAERAKNDALARHITILEHQLAKLKRARFGSQSEKLDQQIRQLELMLEDLQTTRSADKAAEPTIHSNPTPSSARRALPEHLPRETIEHGKQHDCEHCGQALSLIGEDVSEQLEYVPASFRVIRHCRPKYRCDECDRIVQAPAPSKPIPKGYAGAGLLAHVAVAKYCDHLPLYRQSAIYAREGVELERSTLADWVGRICHLLRPLHNALYDYVIAGAKLHGDDTPVPVLQPGRKTTKQGRLWGYLRDDRPAGNTGAAAVWFAYTPDRKGKWPAEHLASYSGTLQADGYAGYNALYATGRIQEAACWAHVRRHFVEIDRVQPESFATEVLHTIAELYAIEKRIKGKSPDQRVKARQARAGPLLEQLKERLRETLSQVPKKLPLAKAIHYALVRWEALLRYVDNGTLEIDNNAIEREIRPIALGRKNYLFAGSDAGGERAAMMYSLINTAKLNGVEPEAYLRQVISVVNDHPVNRIDELLPWNIAGEDK